ncbi:Peptidase family M50 [Musa troglodytarum]|uniref:Peptidase family M50 n=1 Tax=Musa troglodytarum TaxID=320322 RepID=A0A9E7K7C3_9LILI|nr:Peptidase family M50 [Musa troglodytarum]
MSCNWLLKCNIISDTTSGFSSAAFLEPSRSRAQAQADGFGDRFNSGREDAPTALCLFLLLRLTGLRLIW